MDAAKKLLQRAYDKISDTIESSIPESIQETPYYIKYPLGIIVILGSYVALAYFTSDGFIQASGSTFISITNGSDPCNLVDRPLTGKYLASYSGFWEGSSSFNYPDSMYQFSFSNFVPFQDSRFVQYYNTQGSCDFACLVKNIEQQMIKPYAKAAIQPLVYNLLVWINFVGTVQTGVSTQYFSFTGSADAVFNRPLMWSKAISASSSCDAYSSTFFDISTSTFQIAYNYNEFMNQSCDSVINPNSNGYAVAATFRTAGFTTTTANLFKLNFDMRSISLAMSINLGVASVSSYNPIGAPVFSFTPKYVPLKGSYFMQDYMNPLYPGMQSMSCLFSGTTAKSSVVFCTYRLGENYMMPVFNSFGGPASYAFMEPDYCGCDAGQSGHTKECNSFAFLNGLVFFDVGDTQYNVEILLYLYSFYGSYKQFNQAFYNASFYAAVGDTAKAIAFLNELAGPSSHMIVVASGDDPAVPSSAVSSYKYNVPFGSCNNSFTTPFYSRLEVPSMSLVESYYNCTNSAYTNFMNSIGVAQGNVGTLLDIFGLVVPSLIALVLYLVGYKKPEEEKSEEENPATGVHVCRCKTGETPSLLTVKQVSDGLAGANICTLEALVGSMELSQSSVAALTGVGFDLAKSPNAFLLTSREVFVNFTDMTCERMQALYGVDVATSGAMVDYLGPLFRGESETTRGFLKPVFEDHAIEMTELTILSPPTPVAPEAEFGRSSATSQGQGPTTEPVGAGKPLNSSLFSVSADGTVIPATNKPVASAAPAPPPAPTGMWPFNAFEDPPSASQQPPVGQPVGAQQSAPGPTIPFYGNVAAGFAMMTTAMTPAAAPESKSNDAFLAGNPYKPVP